MIHMIQELFEQTLRSNQGDIHSEPLLQLILICNQCPVENFIPTPTRRSSWPPKRLVRDKAADDLFENGVVLRMGHELRGDFDAPAVLKVVAVEPPQAKLAVPGALQQQGADMRLFRAPADHADTVM